MPDALAHPAALEARAHGQVAHLVGGQHGAVLADLARDALDALGLAVLEVGDGIGDRLRQPEGVDLLFSEPPLRLKLADQVAAVELLDDASEVRAVEAGHVDDLGLHRPVDRRGEGLDGLDRVVAVGRQVPRDGDGLAERHAHAPTEGFARLEGEADGHEGERLAPARGAARLVLEGDAGGARLDPLDARLGMRRALRVDADEPPAARAWKSTPRRYRYCGPFGRDRPASGTRARRHRRRGSARRAGS